MYSKNICWYRSYNLDIDPAVLFLKELVPQHGSKDFRSKQEKKWTSYSDLSCKLVR